MKRSFFQVAVVSLLLYGCTTWKLTKRPEKKLDGNYTRMLRAILNKSWQQHPKRHQLYGHLPSITKTILVRRTRHAGHCWRSRGEIISDVLLWTPTYGRAKAGQLARTYIRQWCEDIGYSPEDQPEPMNDREKWPERVRDIRASGTTRWWWWSFEKLNYRRFFCFNTKYEQSFFQNIHYTTAWTHFRLYHVNLLLARYDLFYLCRGKLSVTSSCDKKLTAPNITAQLNKCLDKKKNVSRSAVKRRLCEAGLYERWQKWLGRYIDR